MAHLWRRVWWMIPLAFVIGMVTGLWNGFGTFPPYSQALTAVGASGLTAVAVLRRGDTVRWIRGDPDLPVLHIDCGRGLPWDHPGFDSGLSKMVRVTNTGSVVAPRCFAEVEGIEPLPIRGVWMDQHVESPDLAPGQSLYLSSSSPRPGWRSGSPSGPGATTSDNRRRPSTWRH